LAYFTKYNQVDSIKAFKKSLRINMKQKFDIDPKDLIYSNRLGLAFEEMTMSCIAGLASIRFCTIILHLKKKNIKDNRRDPSGLVLF